MSNRIIMAIRKIAIEDNDSPLIVFDSKSTLYGFSPLFIFLIPCLRALLLIGNEIKVVIIAKVNRISMGFIAHVFVVSISRGFIINPMPTADR